MLDPQVSPEEIKSREVELGLRVGLLSPQLFPNGGATDIVFVTLFCMAVGTAIAWCGGRCAMPDGHCLHIWLFWRRSTAAFVFRVGACNPPPPPPPHTHTFMLAEHRPVNPHIHHMKQLNTDIAAVGL